MKHLIYKAYYLLAINGAFVMMGCGSEDPADDQRTEQEMIEDGDLKCGIVKEIHLCMDEYCYITIKGGEEIISFSEYKGEHLTEGGEVCWEPVE